MNSHNFFKSLLFLATSFVLFSCGEDAITTNSTDDCPEMAFTYTNAGSDYYFEADFPGMENLSWYGWTINDDLVDQEGTNVEGDDVLEADFSASGTYEVCLITETPECPLGASYCQTIEIEGGTDPDPSTGCPEMTLVYTESPTEHQFAVSFPNEDGPEIVFWSVNGTYVGDGLTYTANFSEAGTYEVCAGIETAECPMGEFVCHTVVVEGGEDPVDGCPEIEITYSQDGSDFQFTANYEGSLDWYGWTVNGDIVEEEGTINNGDDILTYSFNSIGTYAVCIIHESATCPTLTECIDVTIE